MKPGLFTVTAAIGSLATGVASSASADPFTPLSFRPTAVSRDGSVILGGGVRWRVGGNVTPLPAYNFWGMSADGSTIAAYSSNAAFRVDANGVGHQLPNPPGFISLAYASNADGSVIAGNSGPAPYGPVSHITVWDAQGVHDLGDFNTIAQVVAMSDAGDVIVGSTTSRAVRWTEQTGLQSLGTDPARPGASLMAWGTNADGSAVVGSSWDLSDLHIYNGFVWTAKDGVVNINAQCGVDDDVELRAVSADGNIVGGILGRLGPHYAAIWDSTHGVRNLNSLLLEDGYDLHGATLTSVLGISGDGRVLVGDAIGTGVHGYRVELPVPVSSLELVPEPVALLLFGSLSFGLCRRIRKRI